jgi:hypothetical protein
VKVLVQPPKDSLEAIATEFFSSRSVRVLVGMGHGHYLLSAEAATLFLPGDRGNHAATTVGWQPR